jgi:hypothetical protein
VVESTCCGVILVEVAFSTSFADRLPTIVSATPGGEASPPSHLDSSPEHLGAEGLPRRDAPDPVVYRSDWHLHSWCGTNASQQQPNQVGTARSKQAQPSALSGPDEHACRLHCYLRMGTLHFAARTLLLCYFVRLSLTDQLKRPLSRRRNLCHAHCSTERDASHHGIKSSTHVACKTWLKPGNRARQGRQFNLATGIPGVIIYSEPDVRRQGHYHYQ